MKQKLDFLKDRLSDLSGRNKSIRLMKLYDKHSMDIFSFEGNGVLDFILEGKKDNFPLLKRDMKDEESMVLGHKLTTLSRHVKEIEEETGMHDFYLGYPFLTGKMQDGTFFRGPVFLFPVKVERSGMNWTLVKGEGDKVVNRSLLLALKKLNEFNIEEEMMDEERMPVIHSIKDVQQWFKQFDYDFPITSETLMKFQHHTLKDLPPFEKGEIVLENLAVMGIFPQGNSAIIKDYDLLKKLLEEGGDLGFVSRLLFEESEFINDSLAVSPETDVRTVLEENEKVYLLPTDGSQEEILGLARTEKGLVVHGPPGTGKSQVIVNLVTDAIHKGKKVLVVCQKRAALDVVYQRLDSLGLSPFAALIHDEKSDRPKVYSKMKGILTTPFHINEMKQKEFERISSQLMSNEEQLNGIAKALFEVQDYGYRAYDLYSMAKPKEEMERFINVKPYISAVTRYNLGEMLAQVYTYGEYYSQFGHESYPWKKRKNFAGLELADQSRMIDVLKDLIESAKVASNQLEQFEQDYVTPEYAQFVGPKIEKVYEDLDEQSKRSFKGVRLWWWTSVSGKSIIEELLQGKKFTGTNSKEWLKVRQWLRTLHELSMETEKFAEKLKVLNTYLEEEVTSHLHMMVREGKIPLTELEQLLAFMYSDFEALRRMDRFYGEKDENIVSMIKLVMEEIPHEKNKTLPRLWVESIRDSVYLQWIDDMERKYPQIELLSTDQFHRIRESFTALIEEKREAGKYMLQNEIMETIEGAKATYGKGMKELMHQVSKKRQVWSLRRLVNEFSDKGLMDLMPIWLLSPEIISSVLPLKEELFDLVIFDEASQCTVENGLPAIYRGKHVVVAGDEMQLPPTNLFRSTTDIEEEDEDFSEIDESKSLLNLSKRHFKERILQWHYRSKSEELINFSNYAYYDANIQIAPNVQPLQEPPAIEWKKVNGLWINQSNLLEAQEVVKLLKKQLMESPNLSVGVITFNAKQQDKILDEIDNLVENDLEFAAIYHQVQARELDERIFVKNIENVQGDERDVIIFSVGYAKSENGRVYNRFGPLSQVGGENRLNVAVSRSREKIMVVSSIEPSELDVSNVKNRGPKLFKAYLEYAKATSESNKEAIKRILNDVQDGSHNVVSNVNLHFDSGFEVQVYEMLRNLGYEVHTQVGLSGYRIDLAIVHPNDSTKYLLGIECDGAMYHSSPSAKERDVYRQRFLESRGWTIERIWSRNWWKNRSSEIERIERIEHVVKELLEKEKKLIAVK